MKNFLVLTISFFIFVYSNTYARKWDGTTLEIVAESDGTSELTGIHFIKSYKDSGSKISGYFGGGPVYVTLPDVPDQFPAIHALAGANFHLSKFLALNAEVGFDLVEEMFDDDRGDDTSNDLESNQVDVSIALGLLFQLDKSLYLKTYYRHHVFDGIFLPETKVDFVGVRLGIIY